MCTKSAYDIIGGFREIHASEDVIFYETAVSKNFKITQCKTAKAYLSSRRTKGRGFLKTVLEDFRFFKILRLKRSYDRYK